MARFLSYNTTDPNTGNTPLTANGTITIGPIEAGIAGKIAGSVYSDQSGTLLVQQSFDYSPYTVTNGVYTLTPTADWDAQDSIAVTAATQTKIDLDVLAPYIQFKYTNGSSNEATLRVFLRVFGVGSSTS